MPNYCPKCGNRLQAQDSNFCPECGARLKMPIIEANMGLSGGPSATSYVDTDINDGEMEQIKLNVYDLGIRLESTVAAIFEKMGYSVEMRKRMPTRSGATAEIDLLLRRGNRIKAVECKNYDPSRSVGVAELRIFKSKLEETNIFSGVFVTNTYFSEDAEKLADSVGIELWDGDTLREKFFAYAIGRIKDPSLVHEPVLPLKINFVMASQLTLRNASFIRLYNATLLYHPYMLVKYRLITRRSDPAGKSHLIRDEGTCIIDALDGDIVNRKKTLAKEITGLLKTKEERLQKKEEEAISKDLMSIEPVIKPVLSTNEYRVSIAEPEIAESDAARITQSYVVEKNTRNVSYEIKVKGEIETRYLRIVPKKNEVGIRGTKLVYVPKWILEFEAGQSSFSREILAASGVIIRDDLTKCYKCALLKKSAVAVCEICGIPLCDKHSYYEENKFLCVDHISDSLRNQIKQKGVLSRFLGIKR